MSISLVAVFIPLLFMGGYIGRLFHEFAVTLSLAVLVSGVISLTLTPMLCSRFLKAESDYGKPGVFYRVSESFFAWVPEHCGCKSLKWVLRKSAAFYAAGSGRLTLVATVALYLVVPRGFFPAAGHRLHDGQHRRSPGYFLRSHGQTSHPGLPNGAGRSRSGNPRLICRQRRRRSASGEHEPHNVHHP